MEINRADMKLLIETGYSSVIRNLDVETSAIFEAISTWMPEYAAGGIGTSLELMIAGEFDEADALLRNLVETKEFGKSEAQAMLAMCKALKEEWAEAEKLAEDLEGEGTSAEDFTQVLVHGPPEEVLDQSDKTPQVAAE